MIDYITGWIHYIGVRLGWWTSTSLSVFGLDPKDYDGKVEWGGGVLWTKKKKLMNRRANPAILVIVAVIALYACLITVSVVMVARSLP